MCTSFGTGADCPNGLPVRSALAVDLPSFASLATLAFHGTTHGGAHVVDLGGDHLTFRKG